MRRIDLINAVNVVHQSLMDSGIVHNLFDRQEDINAETLMSSYMMFMENYRNFGEPELELLKIFHLEGIEDSILWANVISKDSKEARSILRDYYSPVYYLRKFLPDVVNLLKQHNIAYETEKNSHITHTLSVIEGKELLTIILPETDLSASNPDRLIIMLQSVELLYKSFSILQSYSSEDLSVVAIDSGSDKSFDFLGNAKIISSIKDFFFGLYDRIIFHKEKKLDQRIELISKTLPIIEEVNRLENEGSISPEQAELLRRDLGLATKNFIKSGAVLPEFIVMPVPDAKRLMSPEPKFLNMPNQPITEEIPIKEDEQIEKKLNEEQISSNRDNPLGALTPEIIEELKKLLQKEQANSPAKKRNTKK